jgi:sugar phosphate permease
MHLSAVAYNLKKYLKFITKKVKNDTRVSFLHILSKYVFKNKQMFVLSSLNFSF